MLLNYFKTRDLTDLWTPVQISAVIDHPNPANPVTFTTAIPNSGVADRTCPDVPANEMYNAQTNPHGVRCTLEDYMVNLFGRRAERRLRQRAVRQHRHPVRPGGTAPGPAHGPAVRRPQRARGRARPRRPLLLAAVGRRPDRAPARLPGRRRRRGQQPQPGRDHRPARPGSRRVPRRLPHLRDARSPAARLRHRGQPGAVARAGTADRRRELCRSGRVRDGLVAGTRLHRRSQRSAGAEDHPGQAGHGRRPLHQRRGHRPARERYATRPSRPTGRRASAPTSRRPTTC